MAGLLAAVWGMLVEVFFFWYHVSQESSQTSTDHADIVRAL